MLVNSWSIDWLEDQRIEIVQAGQARLDTVAFAWRTGSAPIHPDSPRILRRPGTRAVPEFLVPGTHFAVSTNWVIDPHRTLDDVGQAVLGSVDQIDEAELLAICRRDAAYRLTCDESLSFRGAVAQAQQQKDLAQARLEVTALGIEDADLREVALELLRGDWHLGCDELLWAAEACLAGLREGSSS